MTEGRTSEDLARFVQAQRGVYEDAVDELRRGRKTSHWMWFVFPQLAGLGSSAMARLYALSGVAEAHAYLAHPLLGERLRACAALAAGHTGKSASEVFGVPDDLKFRSSMTLFEAADPQVEVFGRALQVLCGGERDAATLHKLASGE